MNSNANARFLMRQARDESMITGKYVQRDNQFKSKRFYFDLDTCEAFSYDWWQFVIKIGNTIYFNRARYSMQTDLHQEMAKNILLWEGCNVRARYGANDGNEPVFKGIRVVYVYYREGLNHLGEAINNMLSAIDCLKSEIANPRSHTRKNKERLKEIARLGSEIKRTRKFKKRVDAQIKLNSRVTQEKNDRIWDAQMKRDALARMKREREWDKRQKELQQARLTLVQGGAQ